MHDAYKKYKPDTPLHCRVQTTPSDREAEIVRFKFNLKLRVTTICDYKLSQKCSPQILTIKQLN